MRNMNSMSQFLIAIYSALMLVLPSYADEFANANPSSAMNLTDLHGKPITTKEIPANGALALVFVTTDCPIANSYQPTISKLSRDFQDRGVTLVLVHEGADQSQDKLEKHAAEYSVPCRLVSDPDHRIAHRLGVSITPEVCVLNNKAETLYQGSIDDLYPGFGKKRPKPTREHLKIALEEITTGAVVTESRTKAVGCSIPKPK